MQLDPQRTALVLIDLQKAVLAMPVAPHSAAEVYEGSKRLVRRFHAAKAPVVWVRVSFSADLADAPAQPVDRSRNYAALPPGWDEFAEPPSASDLVITKRQWGAFYGTELDLQLRRRGVRCIVLAGIATHMGVESTARSAAERGYEIVIPEDLCSGLSVETHTFSFNHVFPHIARVTTSDKITFI